MEITNGLGLKSGSQTPGKRDLAKAAQGVGTRLARGKRELVVPALEGTAGKGAGQRQGAALTGTAREGLVARRRSRHIAYGQQSCS